MADEQRPRLGRGLAALIGDSRAEVTQGDRGSRRIPIDLIRPNPRNPRRAFDEDALEELAASIREKGLIQPIVVRPLEGGSREYEIIAGERRWRASQKAGHHEIPVVILTATERESLELAIIENVQRADLNAVEEARGYEQLMTEFDYTQADLARVIGKSRSHVANMLRLLQLPPDVLNLLQSGEITAGHARALLSVSDPKAAADVIIAEKMTVRDAENLAAREKGDAKVDSSSERHGGRTDPNVKALEKSLSDALGLKVSILSRGDGGEVRIRYSTADQLDAICDRLR